MNYSISELCILFTDLRYVISRHSNYQNRTTPITTSKQQSSAFLSNQCAGVNSKNEHTLGTLLDVMIDTTQQFESAFTEFVAHRIPFYRNGDHLNATLKLNNSNYFISFTDIVFSTATENLLVVDDIHCHMTVLGFQVNMNTHCNTTDIIRNVILITFLNCHQ